jgi:hypothetical protein
VDQRPCVPYEKPRLRNLRVDPLPDGEEPGPQRRLRLFTWDEDPAYANREIDIEFARWGVPQAPNLSFTVQPWSGHPERSAGYEFSAGERTILRFVWEPDRIAFSAESYGKSVSWSFPADEGSTSAPFTVPPVGRERVGINLWLFQGRAPAAPDRVVVERFAFTPMPKR